MNVSASQGNIRAEESCHCLHHCIGDRSFVYVQQQIVLTTSWKSLDNLLGDRPRILDHYQSIGSEHPTTILTWDDLIICFFALKIVYISVGLISPFFWYQSGVCDEDFSLLKIDTGRVWVLIWGFKRRRKFTLFGSIYTIQSIFVPSTWNCSIINLVFQGWYCAT